MAKQRVINTKFWSDPFVVDELNPLDRYLFLYLLTNEKTNIIGAYELSLRTMSNETGIEKEELVRMLQRLESRVVYVMGWVVFRKAIKHQNYNSPKIEIAIVREMSDVPPQVKSYMELPDLLGKLLFEKYGMDTVSSGIALNLTKVTKDNLTKVTKQDSAKAAPEKIPTADISEMMEVWEDVIGMKIESPSNRKACASLIREVGKEKLKQLIRGVSLAIEDKYAPRISDFVSLKRKKNDLIVWGRKNNMNNVEVIS